MRALLALLVLVLVVLPLLAGCSLTSPADPPPAPSLPLLVVTAVSAEPAPAVGQTATMTTDFRFVTPEDPAYSQFHPDFLERLDSLFAADGSVLLEGTVRVHPPGRPGDQSDVLAVEGHGTVSQRVRRGEAVRLAATVRGASPGRAVVVTHVWVRGMAREAAGLSFSCFDVSGQGGTFLGDCVSSSRAEG